MNWKIEWISGCFDEIELVYDKAEENADIAKILGGLEEGALAEAKAQCGAFRIETDGKPVSPQQFDSLPGAIKESLIAHLSDLGLEKFDAPLTEPTINVRLSPAAPLTLCCTAFSILNRLEKLDGAINILHPKMTLNIQAPPGCKKLGQLEILIVMLYPWLTVSENSYAPASSGASGQKLRPEATAQNKSGGQNKPDGVKENPRQSVTKQPAKAAPQQKPTQSAPAAAADKSHSKDSRPGFFARLFGGKDKGSQKAPANTPPPAAKENKGTNAAANANPYAGFYNGLKSKKPFLTAVNKAKLELEHIISNKLLGLKSPAGGDLTLSGWKALSETDKMQYILAVGAHGITPSMLLCIDFAELIPNCLALTLLYYAYTGEIENQLLDTGNGTDIRCFRAALESLKSCCPKWSYKILTE